MAIYGAAWRWTEDGTVNVVKFSADEPLDKVANAMLEIGYEPDTLAALSNVNAGTIAKARDSRSTRIRTLRDCAGGGLLPWWHGGRSILSL